MKVLRAKALRVRTLPGKRVRRVQEKADHRGANAKVALKAAGAIRGRVPKAVETVKDGDMKAAAGTAASGAREAEATNGVAAAIGDVFLKDLPRSISKNSSPIRCTWTTRRTE